MEGDTAQLGQEEQVATATTTTTTTPAPAHQSIKARRLPEGKICIASRRTNRLRGVGGGGEQGERPKQFVLLGPGHEVFVTLALA